MKQCHPCARNLFFPQMRKSSPRRWLGVLRRCRIIWSTHQTIAAFNPGRTRQFFRQWDNSFYDRTDQAGNSRVTRLLWVISGVLDLVKMFLYNPLHSTCPAGEQTRRGTRQRFPANPQPPRFPALKASWCVIPWKWIIRLMTSVLSLYSAC